MGFHRNYGNVGLVEWKLSSSHKSCVCHMSGMSYYQWSAVPIVILPDMHEHRKRAIETETICYLIVILSCFLTDIS